MVADETASTRGYRVDVVRSGAWWAITIPALDGVFSQTMMEGIPMLIIQRQLEHVSLATTDRYLAHIAPKQVIETMGEREWSP